MEEGIWMSGHILIRLARDILTEKVKCEERLEKSEGLSHAYIEGKVISGKRYHKCKHWCRIMACSRNNQPEGQCVSNKVNEGDSRQKMGEESGP